MVRYSSIVGRGKWVSPLIVPLDITIAQWRALQLRATLSAASEGHCCTRFLFVNKGV